MPWGSPINHGNFRILTYSAGVNSPVRVQIVHVPTGIVAEAINKSRKQAESNALAKLAIALIERENKGTE